MVVVISLANKANFFESRVSSYQRARIMTALQGDEDAALDAGGYSSPRRAEVLSFDADF